MSSSGQSPMELLFGKGSTPTSIVASPTTDNSKNGSPLLPTGSKRYRQKPTNKVAPGTPQTPPSKRQPQSPDAAQLSVLVTRTDLHDEFKLLRTNHNQQQHHYQQQHHQQQQQLSDDEMGEPMSPSTLGCAHPSIAEYRYVSCDSQVATEESLQHETSLSPSIAIVRVAPSHTSTNFNDWSMYHARTGMGTISCCTGEHPAPILDPSIQKYWNQRQRLFSRFDQGIQLDEQGWFSVTPEQIAHHVAARTVDLYKRIVHHQQHQLKQQHHQQQKGMIILDAFGGCGGNALAFAQNPAVSQVICVDIDRSKLQRAANNASIYQIPTDKILFVECNAIFLLEFCFRQGIYSLDQPIATLEAAMDLMAAMPPPVALEIVKGYQVGGIDILPRTIDAIFMDPPWGGVDYEVFGKQGYCLEANMLIPRPTYQQQKLVKVANEGVGDAFFDTFTSTQPRSKQERMAAFNSGLDATNCVNGAELLKLAARSAPIVVYDIPRNTSRMSLGQAAVKAGYLGNCKLEEHYLNGRLKTVSAYFGVDWREELIPTEGSH